MKRTNKKKNYVPMANGGTYFEAARAASIAMQQDLSNVIGKMSK